MGSAALTGTVSLGAAMAARRRPEAAADPMWEQGLPFLGIWVLKNEKIYFRTF